MKTDYIFIIILVLGVIALIADFILKSLKDPVIIPYMRYGSFAAILIGIIGWGTIQGLKGSTKNETENELVPK
jgi:hypothetical protein